MKSLVTYYSYSGNTDRVAKLFERVLKAKGEVDLQRLKPTYEIKDFLGQCSAARTRKRAVLEEGVKFDASPYDLVLIGSPIWAFAPTPALNTYLDKVNGLHGKRAIVFLTSGSGLGVKLCFKNIRTTLENKGVSSIDELNIPDRKQKDEEFIISSLQKLL